MQETQVQSLGQEDPLEKGIATHPRGFPDSSAGKKSTCNVGDLGLIPGLGRPLKKRKATQSVFWPAESHGLYSPSGHKESDTTELLSLSSIFAWRIPWTEEKPGGLQPVGSQKSWTQLGN